MKNIYTKVRVFIATLIAVMAPALIVYAALNTLNGQSGASQTFTNDPNVTISSASNVHTIGWSGVLPISRGGTNNSSFATGTVPFFDGTQLVGDTSQLFLEGTFPDAALILGAGLTVNGELELRGNGDFQIFQQDEEVSGIGMNGTDEAGQLRLLSDFGHMILDLSLLTTGHLIKFPDRDGVIAVLEGSASSTIKIGDIKSCIVMADTDGSGVGYVTMNDGVLTATTTQPSNCQ